MPSMTTRTRSAAKPLPEGWVRTEEVKLPGLAPLSPGVEVSIRGERGRWVFHHLTEAPRGSWVTVTGGHYGHWRSFDPSRVKTVHRTRKLRTA